MAQTRSSLKTLEDAARDLATALKLPAPRGQSEREALCLAAHRAMEAPGLAGVPLQSDLWRTHEEELRTLLNAGLTLAGIHVEFDRALKPGAWDRDLFQARQTLAAKGGRWWRCIPWSWCVGPALTRSRSASF